MDKPGSWADAAETRARARTASSGGPVAATATGDAPEAAATGGGGGGRVRAAPVDNGPPYTAFATNLPFRATAEDGAR